MNPQEFDRIMSRDEEIEPEPGFLHSVMTAVRNDAAIPPRIRFPWLCVLPQLLVWCIALAWAVTDSIPLRDRMPGVPSAIGSWGISIEPILKRADAFGAGWILLALASTAVCLMVTRQLAGRLT